VAAYKDYKVANLVRGLSILELMVQHPNGLGTSEINRLTDYPKSFVYRATGALLQLGYLERDDKSKKFFLSRKLLTMGTTALHQSCLMEYALPVMRELREETREGVYIAGMDQARGVMLEYLPALHAFRFFVDTGHQFDLHCAAQGKAMLAALPEEKLKSVLSGMKLTRHTERTITSQRAFRAELRRVRARGYAVDRAEAIEGIHCIAAVILNAKSFPVAALGVTAPLFRMPEADFERIGQRVKSAARKVSRKLGYQETSV
jgi:DNA-binding IclR family transcriptional regulator